MKKKANYFTIKLIRIFIKL